MTDNNNVKKRSRLDNLVPFTSEQNREEAAKNGHKGGIASGKARREKKTLANIIQAWADGKPNVMMKKQLLEFGIPVPDDMTAIEALFEYAGLKILDKKANSGDVVKLVETVAKYTGQEPAKEINIVGGLESNIERIKEMEEHFDK